MASQINLERFNEIYDETYYDILKYIIINCHNINDANDIIQEVYLEFWKILNKKDIKEINIKNYLIGISINKIKKHYTLVQKIKYFSLIDKDNDKDLYENVSDNINIESIIIDKDNWNNIWKYIKNMKNQNIPKMFYLYYCLDLSIKEISESLNVKESYTKNLIYRTLKELKDVFGKEIE